MSRIFVIAGNHAEATDWMKGNIKKRIANGETTVSYSDYALRPNADSLSGIANPHGVFIGTWRERNDMHDVFMKLINHTQTTSPSHRIILSLYKEWKEYKA